MERQKETDIETELYTATYLHKKYLWTTDTIARPDMRTHRVQDTVVNINKKIFKIRSVESYTSQRIQEGTAHEREDLVNVKLVI